MKFKVGDKVKLVRTKDESFLYQIYLGKEYTIKDILNADFGKYAVLKETNVIFPYLKNLELVNKKYTYEDLKKVPIGTKVTIKGGETFIKIATDFYSRKVTSCFSEVITDDDIKQKKIIKIEEPTYETVYESKVEILDEVEKRYLSNFIRPFRDEVYYIAKHEYYVDNIKYYRISIVMKNDDDIYLPRYNKKMYKGMETNKKYTIKELGI